MIQPFLFIFNQKQPKSIMHIKKTYKYSSPLGWGLDQVDVHNGSDVFYALPKNDGSYSDMTFCDLWDNLIVPDSTIVAKVAASLEARVGQDIERIPSSVNYGTVQTWDYNL